MGSNRGGGQRPKPTELRQTSGIIKKPLPPRNLLGAAMTKFDQVPPPPGGLTPDAYRAWMEMAPLLHQMGVLTKSDPAALIQLCEAYADVRMCRQTIADAGSAFYESHNEDTGNTIVRQHPALQALDLADKRLHRWMVEFGLTPSSRVKLAPAPAGVTGGEKGGKTIDGGIGDYFTA